MIRAGRGVLESAPAILVTEWWDAAADQRRGLVESVSAVDQLPAALESRVIQAAADGDDTTRAKLLAGPLGSSTPKSASLVSFLLGLARQPGEVGARSIQALQVGVATSDRERVVLQMLALVEGAPATESWRAALAVVGLHGGTESVPRLERMVSNPSAETDLRLAAEHALTRVRRRLARRSFWCGAGRLSSGLARASFGRGPGRSRRPERVRWLIL